MKIDIDYKIGQSIYLRSDEEQTEYRVNRIIIGQKGLISLELWDSISCNIFEVDEVHCSKEKDVIKTMGLNKKEEEPE